MEIKINIFLKYDQLSVNKLRKALKMQKNLKT